ncbi:hypothetical protein N0V90_013231 [Kalmusia sp. IMI 367209]|nr:hypothetical protein N0V90_013231 [Kalmusia sp. IMI 367209]
MPGESGPADVSLPKAMTIAAFFGISVYNSIEILFSIFHRFKTHNALYFWSMLMACIGIPVHATAVLLRNFGLAPNVPMCVFIVLGWWAMVTGQAVVLYSRLHLVSNRNIRWVLIMIITNFVVLHLPVSGLYLALNVRPTDSLTNIFSIYEKIQLTGFSVQEWIIAGLYIWGASRALKPILKFKGEQEKKAVRNLTLINLMVIAMDASLLVTEFTNNFEIQTTYKTVVYSIKLKLEFYVLNQLLFVIQKPDCSQSNLHTSFNFDAGMSDVRLLSSRLAPTLRKSPKTDSAAETQFTSERVHRTSKATTRRVSIRDG